MGGFGDTAEGESEGPTSGTLVLECRPPTLLLELSPDDLASR